MYKYIHMIHITYPPWPIINDYHYYYYVKFGFQYLLPFSARDGLGRFGNKRPRFTIGPLVHWAGPFMHAKMVLDA